MAGNDVFLYGVPSDANPNDVRLRDPTQPGVPVVPPPVNNPPTAQPFGWVALQSWNVPDQYDYRLKRLFIGVPPVTDQPFAAFQWASTQSWFRVDAFNYQLRRNGLVQGSPALVVPPVAPVAMEGGGGGYGPIRWSRQLVVPAPETVLRIYYDPKPAKVWPRRVAKVTKEIWYPKRVKRPVKIVEDDDTEALLAILLAIDEED